MSGKTIKVFLTDGSVNGLLTAELTNRTIHLLVFNRGDLAKAAKRSEVERTGVYILVGDITSNEILSVYVGEGDNVLKRLQKHNSDAAKEFWIQTVVITNKDDSLTKAHVRYLESRLIDIITRVRQVHLTNGTNPDSEKFHLPESDVASMEELLDDLQLLLPVLGFTFAKTPPQLNFLQNARVIGEIVNNQSQSDTVTNGNLSENPIFYMNVPNSNPKVTAKAQEVQGEFVVFKGSYATKNASEKFPYAKKRQELLATGKLKLESDAPSSLRIFDIDCSFAGPTAAAAVIAGTARSGLKDWKIEGTDQTYGEWKDNILKAALANSESTELANVNDIPSPEDATN
jgi:hypothetical protein